MASTTASSRSAQAAQTMKLKLKEILAMPDGPEKSRALMRHNINKSRRRL